MTLYRLFTSIGNDVNISLIPISLGYFVDVKSYEIASDTMNDGRIS